jgi:hypothetical protein
MQKQVDVDILSDAGDDAAVRARWFICDNGITVADGVASYLPESGKIDWNGDPPPADLYADVLFEIDRAVSRRRNRPNSN